jgi:hypothetical protein
MKSVDFNKIDFMGEKRGSGFGVALDLADYYEENVIWVSANDVELKSWITSRSQDESRNMKLYHLPLLFFFKQNKQFRINIQMQWTAIWHPITWHADFIDSLGKYLLNRINFHIRNGTEYSTGSEQMCPVSRRQQFVRRS